MQTKLKFSTIMLTVLFAIMPLTVNTANAQSFDLHLPSFGLYCQSQNADIQGKVKYVIDGNGKAVQYSDYSITSTNENLTVYIPFISNSFNIPQIDISVKTELCYGNTFSVFNDKITYDFYSPDIDGMTGTVYTLNASSNSFTVEFTTLENQNYIYRLPQGFNSERGERHFTYTASNAQTDIPYEIFIINGDCKEFETTTEVAKETVTVKEYIDRYVDGLQDYFSASGNVETDLFCALIKQALAKDINYDFLDFFLNSYNQQRFSAYKIIIDTPYTIAYSMPVEVQKNSAFCPAIFMAEQTATGSYNIDYTIELNSELPFVIESSAEMEKQSEYVYTAQNVTDDFYFVFSSSGKPESIYGDNINNTLNIVLYVVLAAAICVFIVIIIVCCRKYK